MDETSRDDAATQLEYVDHAIDMEIDPMRLADIIERATARMSALDARLKTARARAKRAGKGGDEQVAENGHAK